MDIAKARQQKKVNTWFNNLHLLFDIKPSFGVKLKITLTDLNAESVKKACYTKLFFFKI